MQKGKEQEGDKGNKKKRKIRYMKEESNKVKRPRKLE